MKTITIQLTKNITPAQREKILEMLDRQSAFNPEFNGVDFKITEGDYVEFQDLDFDDPSLGNLLHKLFNIVLNQHLDEFAGNSLGF